MLSGHITIQYMFCMYFMIKKIILEGFNDRGEGNLKGKKLKYFKKSKIIKKIKKTKMYFGFFSTYTGQEPTIFCMWGFFYIPERSGMVPGPGEP